MNQITLYHVYDYNYDLGFFFENELRREIELRYNDNKNELDDDEREYFHQFDMNNINTIPKEFLPDIMKALYFKCDSYTVDNNINAIVFLINDVLVEKINDLL